MVVGFLLSFAHDWITYPFVRRAVDQRTSFASLIWVGFLLGFAHD